MRPTVTQMLASRVWRLRRSSQEGVQRRPGTRWSLVEGHTAPRASHQQLLFSDVVFHY